MEPHNSMQVGFKRACNLVPLCLQVSHEHAKNCTWFARLFSAVAGMAAGRACRSLCGSARPATPPFCPGRLVLPLGSVAPPLLSFSAGCLTAHRPCLMAAQQAWAAV